MREIVVCVEKTTLNTRKMKYYDVTFADGAVQTLTKSPDGKVFLSGCLIEDKEELKLFQEAMRTSMTQAQINSILASVKPPRGLK